MFDKDKSGTIDASEFSQLWNYIQQWKQVFEGFDKDRSGGIDANELHTGKMFNLHQISMYTFIMYTIKRNM